MAYGDHERAMKTKVSTVDNRIVAEIEALLESATTDTRAAVAAACLPGRIRAFSPHYAALKPEDQWRLSESAASMMRGRGQVVSMTGIGAALAINWCESHGHDYVVKRTGEKYVVEIAT